MTPADGDLVRGVARDGGSAGWTSSGGEDTFVDAHSGILLQVSGVAAEQWAGFLVFLLVVQVCAHVGVCVGIGEGFSRRFTDAGAVVAVASAVRVLDGPGAAMSWCCCICAGRAAGVACGGRRGG